MAPVGQGYSRVVFQLCSRTRQAVDPEGQEPTGAENEHITQRCADSHWPAYGQATPKTTEEAPAPAGRFDCMWISPQFGYGFRIQGTTGTATKSNSPRFAPGDTILRIDSVSDRSFRGKQINTGGVWIDVTAQLVDDSKLQMKSRGYEWTMMRQPDTGPETSQGVAGGRKEAVQQGASTTAETISADAIAERARLVEAATAYPELKDHYIQKVAELDVNEKNAEKAILANAQKLHGRLSRLQCPLPSSLVVNSGSIVRIPPATAYGSLQTQAVAQSASANDN